MQGSQSLGLSSMRKIGCIVVEDVSRTFVIRGIVSLSRELSLGNLNPQADSLSMGSSKKDANPPSSKKNKQNAVCYNCR